MTEKLEPCPFCGLTPDLEDDDVCYPLDKKHSIWTCGCPESSGGCGAEVVGNSKEDAIKKWNTRVEPNESNRILNQTYEDWFHDALSTGQVSPAHDDQFQICWEAATKATKRNLN